MEIAKDNLEAIEATIVELKEQKEDEVKRYRDAKTAKAQVHATIRRLRNVLHLLKQALNSRANKYACMTYPEIHDDIQVRNRADVRALSDRQMYRKLRKLKAHGIEKHKDHDDDIPTIELGHVGTVFDRQTLIAKLLKIDMELKPGKNIEAAVDDLLLEDDQKMPPKKKTKTEP